MSRIGIVGGPRTGKSTLARQLAAGGPILCTDPRGLVKDVESGVEYVPNTHADWSAASLYVAEVFLSRPGPWILDGVGLARALRKWRGLFPGQPPPLERLVYLTVPVRELTEGQRRMTLGVKTVLAEIRPWLGALLEEWLEPPPLDLSAASPRSSSTQPARTAVPASTSGLRIYRDTRGLEIF